MMAHSNFDQEFLNATNNDLPRTDTPLAVDADTLAFLGFTDQSAYHPAGVEIDAWGNGNWEPLYYLTHEQLEAAALFKLRRARLHPADPGPGDSDLYAIVEEERVFEFPEAVETREVAPQEEGEMSTLLRKHGMARNIPRRAVKVDLALTPQRKDKIITTAGAAAEVDLDEAQIIHACERGELSAVRDQIIVHEVEDSGLPHSEVRIGWRVNLNRLLEWHRRLQNDAIISIADAATYPGAPSEPTIRLHCGEGKIAGARKIGKSWTMPRRAFEQYLKRRNS